MESTPQIVRVRASTEVKASTPILADAELLALFTKLTAVSRAWLAQQNVKRHPARAAEALVLDFEFRKMASGWPALAKGLPRPARLVVKQARSLDPGIRTVPAALRFAPIPHDLLCRAQRIVRRRCEASQVTFTIVDLHTDPLVAPDLGFSSRAFVASVKLKFGPKFGPETANFGRASAEITLDHLDLESVARSGTDTSKRWKLAVQLTSAAARRLGLDGFSIDSSGAFQIKADHGELGLTGAATHAGCKTELLYATPSDYLLSIINEEAAQK